MDKKIYNTFLNVLIKRKYFLLLFLQMFSNKDEKVYLKYKVFKVLKSNHEAKISTWLSINIINKNS